MVAALAAGAEAAAEAVAAPCVMEPSRALESMSLISSIWSGRSAPLTISDNFAESSFVAFASSPTASITEVLSNIAGTF